MKTAIITFTRKGVQLACKMQNAFMQQTDIYCYQRYAPKEVNAFYAVSALMEQIFSKYDGLLFIGAAAIAVRAAAPHLQSKLTDPAVLVMDENARFVISLLSGHVGGANAWCECVAAQMGAEAVITTTTDTRGVFAVDTFARTHALYILDPARIKDISGRILDGAYVGVYTAHAAYKNLAAEMSEKWGNPVCTDAACAVLNKTKDMPQSCKEAGIQIVMTPEEPCIYEKTLRLVPMDLAVGIGCKRGKRKEAIENVLNRTLQANHLLRERIFAVASIDRKADEAGIAALAEALRVPFLTYTAQQLQRAQGEFTESEWVRSQMGVGNVCERSACLASSGGVRLVEKTAEDGITVSIYQRRYGDKNA